MPVTILNPGNPVVQRQSENAQGLEWEDANVNPTNITAYSVVVEQLQNLQQVSGVRVAAFSGTTGVTGTPSGGGVNVTYNWPSPPPKRPVGNFLVYWQGTYADGHVVDGGAILVQIVPD